MDIPYRITAVTTLQEHRRSQTIGLSQCRCGLAAYNTICIQAVISLETLYRRFRAAAKHTISTIGQVTCIYEHILYALNFSARHTLFHFCKRQ